MSASNPNSPFNDPSYSRERLELETRVLAAALRQSLEIGDTEGSSLAHEQIFLLLKASQEMVIDEPINLPSEVFIDRGRQLPDIDWGSNANEGKTAQGALPGEQEGQGAAAALQDGDFTPPQQSTAQAGVGDMAAASAENYPAPGMVEHQPAESVAESATGQSHGAAAAMPGEASPLQSQASAQAESASQSTEETQSPSGEPGMAVEADYYQHLNVAEVADFHSIHLSFWRQLRLLLRHEINLVGPERLHHLRNIQRLWIAHDILCDPVTRADYDFRRMGVRGGEEEEGGRRTQRGGTRTQLRIGELLQCAGLLEQTELDIAADMHKAMPEMMFGTFLVKQGFIEESDLDCVLVGQQLLKTGDITVVQFQTVMIERSATGLDIGAMLLAKGYVSEAVLERAYREQSEDTLVKVPIVVNVVPTVKATTTPAPAAAATETVESKADNKPPQGAQSTTNVGSAGAVEHDSIAAQEVTAESSMAAEGALSEEAQGGEGAAAGANVRTDRAFNFGNASPSWKDQLDWNSPASGANEAEGEVDERSEADEADIPKVRSRWSAPDVVSTEKNQFISEPAPNMMLPGEGMNDALSESVRAIAQIWAEQPDPASVWANLESSARDQPAEAAAAPTTSHNDSAAGTMPPQQNLNDNPFVEGEGRAQSVSTPDSASSEPEDNAFVDQPASFESASLGTATDPSLTRVLQETIVSEIETSGQLPSLGALELQAKKNEEQRQLESKRTGDWQIMSVPGSALTSLFLDEEPESPAKEQSKAKEVTGSMNAFVDDSEAEQDAAKPQDNQQAATNKEPESSTQGESRRQRRRRTRH